MKKTQILIITLLVAFSSRSQNHVKMDEAKSAAVCFAIKENLAGNLTNTRFDDSVVYPIIDDGDTLLFLYPVKQYYIIVSRFKCFPPILGYFEDPTPYNYQSDIVENNYFVQRYCYYSKKTMRINNDSVSPQWDNLIQNKSKNTNSIVIDTLITS